MDRRNGTFETPLPGRDSRPVQAVVGTDMSDETMKAISRDALTERVNRGCRSISSSAPERCSSIHGQRDSDCGWRWRDGVGHERLLVERALGFAPAACAERTEQGR